MFLQDNSESSVHNWTKLGGWITYGPRLDVLDLDRGLDPDQDDLDPGEVVVW